MQSCRTDHLWTIILAGGDGTRLRPLTRALHGEDRPKQFALIHAGRSLLQATVARAARWSAPERTVVVVASEREALARAQLSAHPELDIVAQPSNRGTGPGLLLPLARVIACDPLAQVVVLPADHYVREEAPFEDSIRRALAASAGVRLALVGAVPNQPETQYGWIVCAPQRGKKSGLVAQFCEKPAAPLAERLFRQGALWNTFVMVGSAGRLWGLAHEHLPGHTQLFEPYGRSVGTEAEPRVLRELYAQLPSADFSTDVLQRARGLGVVPLQACGWSDWGTPERVLESLRHHSDHAFLSRRLEQVGHRIADRGAGTTDTDRARLGEGRAYILA